MLLARLREDTADLLPFEEVRRRLRGRGEVSRGLQEVPLQAIVGSVDRYRDFTRSFLPRRDADEQRWARVRAAVTGLKGLPPVELYKVGEVYFVRDGHHRVSVARDLGAPTIEAYVTEVPVQAPLSPEDRLEDIILQVERAAFLEEARLDRVRPGADLRVTVPGMYDVLLEHIQVHRYFLGLEQQRDVALEEAVASWYDRVYLPLVRVIQALGILRDFPERTETDLYLWLSEHRAALAEELGWEVRPDVAASDLAQTRGATRGVVARLARAVLPEWLEAGPAPGAWRRGRAKRRLFLDLLVPVSGQEVGWRALHQALAMARREGGRVLGLHVVTEGLDPQAEGSGEIRRTFERLATEAGVEAAFRVVSGPVAETIVRWARGADLVVASLAYPPGRKLSQRWRSGIRRLIHRCPTPVLLVPGEVSGLEHLLLAYDDSPKAREALYLSAYLAGAWGCSLTVMTVVGEATEAAGLEQARAYLEGRGLQAGYRVYRRVEVPQALLGAAEEVGADLLVMGGYGEGPPLDLVLGSHVDEILRRTRVPVLLCR